MIACARPLRQGALAVALLLAGCTSSGSSVANAPPQPVPPTIAPSPGASPSASPVASPSSSPGSYTGGAIPSGAPLYKIALNTSGVFSPPGFVVAAGTGNTYRIQWTAQNSPSREFYGSIWTTGTFTLFKPGCSDGSCPIAAGSVSAPVAVAGGGQRIDFDTFPGATLNGVDIQVDAQPVYFDFVIDGARNPARITFPSGTNNGSSSNPGADPFALTP